MLVDPEVSRQKLRRDIECWKATTAHQARGCLLLNYDEELLYVELAFLGKISINAGSAPLPIVVCAIRLTYENYDLWAPSLTFIDAFTRDPVAPHVRAFQDAPNGPQDVLINAHPETHRPFLCLPGIREYHTHPQHSGDSWLLHRDRGEGSVSTISERVWHYMARNILGLRVQMQSLPTWPLQVRLQISLAQGDIDGLTSAQKHHSSPVAAPVLDVEKVQKEENAKTDEALAGQQVSGS
jgi:hypothetical protein